MSALDSRETVTNRQHAWGRGSPALASLLTVAAVLVPALTIAGTFATVTNVNIDGQGTSAILLPAQTFTLTADYIAWNDASCPGCILEIVIAVERDGQACLYLGIPPLEPGTSGTSSVQMVAPSSSGIYTIRFGYALAYSCDEAITAYENRPEPGEAIGTILISGMDSVIEHVNIDGQGTSANVAPGAAFSICMDYTITNPSNCPGCIAQLVLGIEGDGQACAYNDIPPLYPGISGYVSPSLTAPMEPGVYSIRYAHELQYGCEAAIASYETHPPSGNVLGTITVGSFHLRVTNCSIDGQGAHAVAPPGAACSVTLDYTVWSGIDCPYCIDEIVIGIEGDAQACAYEGIPGVAPGVSGTATVELIAPPFSGSFAIRSSLELQLSCALALARYEALPPPENVIGTLEVAVPTANQSWGSIKALYDR